MNKRIRKKKHAGEFRQLGFQIAARYPASVTEEQVEKLDDELISFAESRDLAIGGAIGRTPDAFVTRAWCRKSVCYKHPAGSKRNVQVTDADRDALVQWFKDHGAEAKAGQLIDANHASEAEMESVVL